MYASRISSRLASVFAFGLAASGCSEAVKASAGLEARKAVGSVVVEEVDAPDYRIVTAILTNRDIGDARARIAGKVDRLLVREGDHVRKGQAVAIISDERLDAEFRAAASAVTAAKADAERSAQDLERAERLYEGQAISRAAVDAARADAKSTHARLRTAEAQASAAKAVRDQGSILSPADGKVTRASVPTGVYVMPGEVVVAISTGAQVLRMELPESEGRALRQGQELRIIEGGDGSGVKSIAVRQIYPAVTSGRVTVDLDASGLQPGLIGGRLKVAAPLGVRRTIVIPQTMIITRYGADYVRLKRVGGAVIEVPVQRGMPTPTDSIPDGVEILSGLRPGDEIVSPEPTP